MKIPDYTEESARKQWSRIPIPEVGYISSTELLKYSDEKFDQLVKKAEHRRYNGWRNVDNLWRETLGLDNTYGKLILDYGCGFGLEALQFAKTGNKVILADIVGGNIKVAARTLSVFGHKPWDAFLIPSGHPYFHPMREKVDIFYSNGVLHHTPHAREILSAAKEYLDVGGEVRLMLYSDRGWQWATKTEPGSIYDDVTKHPLYPRFVRRFDSVGHYADWYNREKIEYRFGDMYEIKRLHYITKKNNFSGQYLTTTLKPKL